MTNKRLRWREVGKEDRQGQVVVGKVRAVVVG
jgi:hypothetical protein